MLLLIFESIGTSELILIGVVALIFLGPRKMPEYAKKIGKLMNEFRSTTNEFKATWEREVNFDDETAAFKLGEDKLPVVPRAAPMTAISEPTGPTITEIDPGGFQTSEAIPPSITEQSVREADETNDKRNWL